MRSAARRAPPTAVASLASQLPIPHPQTARRRSGRRADPTLQTCDRLHRKQRARVELPARAHGEKRPLES